MTATPQPAGVLTFDQAHELVAHYCRKISAPKTESLSLLEALGRIVAEPIFADRDFPPFPRATRDGYAVRSGDSGGLVVVGQVKAGSSFDRELQPGHAVEIMTGAAVPAGADAVVMVEHTTREGNIVRSQKAVAKGENIVPQGSEARAGQEMLPRGTRMGFPQIAVAAAVGQSSLEVYRKPRVAIVSTGDEVVDVSESPGPQQIRNSNSYSLAAQVLLAGGEPQQLPIAPDDLAATKKLVAQGLTADLLLLSGGVSMGKFDFVEQALAELDARFFFTGALIQPGKPVVFGEVANTPFFGLPGNPISTMVTFDLFARPVLHALSGALPVRLPTAQARLAIEIKTRTGLTRFLPAVMEGGLHHPHVEVLPWQGSGDLQTAARANCYVVVPPDRELMPAGEMITVLLR